MLSNISSNPQGRWRSPTNTPSLPRDRLSNACAERTPACPLAPR
jgi:hypothetical protein